MTHRILSSAERRRNSDLAEIRPAERLLDEVQDRLGRVDGRAAADAHDRVRARGVERGDTVPDVRDGRVLADLKERRARVRAVRFEDVFDGFDDVGLLYAGAGQVVSVSRRRSTRGKLR